MAELRKFEFGAIIEEKTMERKKCESSSIASIGYDIVDGALVLEVEFTRGAIYHYFDVSYDVYTELMEAESIGSYFGKNIAKKYKFVKVEE